MKNEGKKKLIFVLKGDGGNDRNAQYISLFFSKIYCTSISSKKCLQYNFEDEPKDKI